MPTSIPFVRPALPSLDALQQDIERIFATGELTKGRLLAEFERRLAEHLQVKHAIGVSSCTSGLMLSYRGLGLTGEVIVPSFTFMATVTAMEWTGLRPVFVEVNPQTTNIDPHAAEAAVTSRTSAIVAVHNFGNPAEIDALQKIADRHGLKLLFDAAHGFGCRYNGVPVGGQGDAHAFSMSPTKLLVAGEGGVVATNRDDLAAYIRQGREYGNPGNYDCEFAGLNARMPELSALVGLHSLAMIEDVAEERNRQAAAYRRGLSDLPGLEFQAVRPEDRCSYKDFSMVVDPEAFGMSRDKLASILADAGVDTRNYYDPPVHRQSAFRHYAQDVQLPTTDRLATCSISLPMGPQVSDEGLSHVCDVIRNAHQQLAAVEAAAV